MEQIDLDSLGLPNGLYYALPMTLVELISEPHRGLLTTDEIRQERKVSDAADRLGCIGFSARRPVNHSYLKRQIARGLESLLGQLGGVENPDQLAQEFYETLEQNHRFVQGYCGWLVSNSEFLKDLDCQLEKSPSWQSLGLPQATFGRPHNAVEPSGSHAEEVRDWRWFCQKWRLQSMETLDLPRPFEPQFTNSSPFTGQMPPGMSAPVIPDIYPIKGKGTIADQIESIRSRDDHLAEWKSLISSTSRTTKRVDSFGRQFQLQHFWRVLFQRYPNSLSRSRMKLQQLFADYFEVEADSIKRDLKAMQAIISRPLSNCP